MADVTLLSSILNRSRVFGDEQLRPGKVVDRELLNWLRMWCYRCVSLNANACASIPFKLYSTRRIDSGSARALGYRKASPRAKAHIAGRLEVEPGSRVKAMVSNADDLTEITAHPVLELLRDVNEFSDGFAWRYGVYADLQVFGKHFTHLVSDTEMWRMLPHQTEVVRSPSKFVEAFEHGTGSDKARFDPGEVLWIRLFDPWDPWGAYGPLEAWLDTIKASHYVQQFQKDIFERGGSPDYIVKGGAMTPAQQRTFAQQWKKMFGRFYRRVRTVAFLGPDTEIERISDSMKELEYSESANMLRDQIGQAFGVPKSLLTSDDVNRANGRESRDAHFREIWYLVQRVEDALNEQLVQQYGPGLILCHENPIVGDQAIRIADRESKLRSGWSVNEIRAESGAEALTAEGADDPLIGSGLTPLERAVEPPPPPPMIPGGPDADAEQDGDADLETDEDAESESAEASKAATASASDIKALGTLEGGPLERQTLRLQRSLAGVMATHALEIRARVDQLPEGSMVVLDAVMPEEDGERMVERIRDVTAQPLRAQITVSGEDALKGVKPGAQFAMLNERVRSYVDDAGRRIGREATDSWRKEIRREMLKGLDEGESSRQIAKRIERVTDRSPAQAERIARTEMAFAHTAGTLEGWTQSGVVMGKRWSLSADPCPACEAMAAEVEGQVFPLPSPFLGLGQSINGADGSEAVKANYVDIQGPPLHPHCRCTMAPVLEGEG